MRHFLFIPLPLLILILNGCNESLPVYNPPVNVLSASIAPLNAVTDTVKYTMTDNNNPNLVRITLNSSDYGYEIRIINNYEETLQDNLEIAGTVELSWNDKPDLKASIPVTNTNLYTGDYDPATGLLTVNPGDTVFLRIYWNFKLTTLDWSFSQLRFTDGPPYFVAPLVSAVDRVHSTMLMNAKVKVKLFRSLSFMDGTSPEPFPVIFKGKVLSPP